MYIRPKLKDVCDLIESIQGHYLKLNESGGFEVLGYYTEGAVEIVGSGNLRKSVRKALDLLEKQLHDKRRETSRFNTTEED